MFGGEFWGYLLGGAAWVAAIALILTFMRIAK